MISHDEHERFDRLPGLLPGHIAHILEQFWAPARIARRALLKSTHRPVTPPVLRKPNRFEFEIADNKQINPEYIGSESELPLSGNVIGKSRTRGWCCKCDDSMIAQHNLDLFEQAWCRSRCFIVLQFPISGARGT
jgi:hypothetical protein